jgi:hypothetical protein
LTAGKGLTEAAGRVTIRVTAVTGGTRPRAEEAMTKRLKDIKEIKIERPPRAKLTADESLKRTQEFDKRKDRFIASIRKGKG